MPAFLDDICVFRNVEPPFLDDACVFFPHVILGAYASAQIRDYHLLSCLIEQIFHMFAILFHCRFIFIFTGEMARG